MEYIVRIALVFCLMASVAFAEKLELKFNGKNIELPYWSAVKNQHGAVILINGSAKNSQWSILLARLAQQLADNGWSAVLLNCNAGNPEPWVKELPEVVNNFRQQKSKRVVVLHYGDQLSATLDAFDKSKSNVEGLILLSAYNVAAKAQAQTPSKQPELNMPLFDISGQFDYDLVAQQKESRKKDFAKNKYLAIEIPGATHDYEYNDKLVLSFIYGWMSKLAEFKPTPPPVNVSYIEPIAPLLPQQIALDEESDFSELPEPPAEEPTQEIMPR